MGNKDIILKAENISKQYRLGLVGTGTISHDLNRWWSKIRGKEDPYLKVGESNDRSTKGNSEYVWALQDINFEVKRGEVLGIIGKNGAGKSTLLKILSKVTGPTTGEIKTRGRIASLLEVGTGFHGEMTGRENVYLNGAILGMTKKEIASKIDEIIEFSGCQRYIDTPVKRYSSGMTVRLAFAVAAFLEPEILVIDEVLAVGDAEFQKKAIGKMQDISRGEGRTVLFVSHNMAAVKNLCTRAIVLQQGRIVFDGGQNESVDYYFSNTREINKNYVLLNDAHRRKSRSKESILKSVKLISKESLLNKVIELEIVLKTINFVNNMVCVTGTICNSKEEILGSFFSDSFRLHKGEMKINLTILNSNLALGEYYMNFSISKGRFRENNLEMLDNVYEAIGFDVFNEINLEGGNTYKWDNSWGNFHFKSIIKQENN
ncbi:ABC transporter ATP-binding protein [Algibacter pacificus]|uniref:ABC transporter ATP-binding protein n=1 Tax=Algibacter pacificus TaxID=2599389 RepID=UPI0011CCCA83|nr:ABC transporter ATP-binding protein [Algibacter pacificus]